MKVCGLGLGLATTMHGTRLAVRTCAWHVVDIND